MRFGENDVRRISRAVRYVEKNLMRGESDDAVEFTGSEAPPIQFIRCVSATATSGLYPAALDLLTDAAAQTFTSFGTTKTPSSTNTTTEIVTFASAHAWGSGTAVTPTTTGGGLTAGTVYYINAASSTTLSFHTTRTLALAGTSKVNLTASITSVINQVGVWLAFANGEVPTAGTRYGCKLSGTNAEVDGLPIFEGLFPISSSSSSTDLRFLAEGRIGTASAQSILPNSGTGATLIYVPYHGSRISLYDGSSWQTITMASSTSISTWTDATNYDIFGYLSAGVLVLEKVAWTNGTTRATTLAFQNGVVVKSGDATRRYLGTVRASATNQVENSPAKRFIWNMYNRIAYPFYKLKSGTWTYNSDTVRQAGADANAKVEYVTGISNSDAIIVGGHSAVDQGTDGGTGSYPYAGFGIDSTTVPMTTSGYNAVADYIALRYFFSVNYTAEPFVGAGSTNPGYHYLAMLESANNSRTYTFLNHEIYGTLWC